MATSFFVILTSLQSLVFFGGSLLIFSIGIIILNTDPVQISGYILNAVICVALACFISKINYRFFVEDYINKRDLINKKKKLEEHERSNTIFLANTSHELKTPLNLIYSSEQMLDIYLEKFITESEVKKKFSRYLNIIRQNCYRLMRIIGNIVDSTKMEVGEYKIDINNYNIIAIIEQIVESIRSYIETQGINFSFTTHRDRKVIACDPDSIERILLNLISNAVKYTPEGGRIEVQVYTEGEEVVLSIKDNGCGIPHELQSSIFERYVQSDDSFTKKLGGSGIGLSLVRYLVEMHQGDIELNSVPGEGSEFIIKLPDRLVAEPEQTIDEEILDNDKIIENIKLEFSDIYTDLN
ncbi:MAG: sensor histidine kinase [Halanaerobiales bacterium]